MARDNTTYNARRRFLRAAKRYLDKAKASIGSARERYRAMAADLTRKAAELYTRQADIQRSANFRELAKEFNLNVNEFLPGREGLTDREEQRRQRLIEESENVRSSVPTEKGFRPKTVEETREDEARAILNSPIGSRIYAGLIEIWAKPQFENGELVYRRSQDDVNQLIKDYFGASSMMDVLEMLQAANPDLYKDPKSLERYNSIRLSIYDSVLENA